MTLKTSVAGTAPGRHPLPGHATSLAPLTRQKLPVWLSRRSESKCGGISTSPRAPPEANSISRPA
eukprot:8969432-Pyramimonas_sp.AAC.1